MKKGEIQKSGNTYLVVTKTSIDALGRERADEALDVTDSIKSIVKDEIAWHCGMAVGKDPEDAIRNLADAMKWGRKTVRMGDPLEGGNGNGSSREFDWGFRFHAGEVQTSFKAAGVNKPGGVVLTWWK